MKIGSLIRISEPWIRVESGVGEWVVVQSAWIDSENLAPSHVWQQGIPHSLALHRTAFIAVVWRAGRSIKLETNFTLPRES